MLLVTGAGIPLAVIQGEKDPFGSPADLQSALGTAAQVVAARGNHSFTKTPVDVLAHARTFLAALGAAR
jgi:fermentation-respiration switch protein FrsA (DUF1100 family)